jgi:hypothetical protein
MPEPAVLKSVREMIAYEEGFLETIPEGFSVVRERMLVRVPKGFAAGSPVDEFLKLKDVCIERGLGGGIDWAVKEFEKTKDFVALLNRAVDYAYSN